MMQSGLFAQEKAFYARLLKLFLLRIQTVKGTAPLLQAVPDLLWSLPSRQQLVLVLKKYAHVRVAT
jgi:hypothetical protein